MCGSSGEVFFSDVLLVSFYNNIVQAGTIMLKTRQIDISHIDLAAAIGRTENNQSIILQREWYTLKNRLLQ